MLVGMANKRFLIGLRTSWPVELDVDAFKLSHFSRQIGSAPIVDRFGYMGKLG